MALASLSIDLNAKLANLQQGLDKAGRLAERQAGQIERAFSGLKTVGAGVGAALAASLSVAGITQFVRSTVDGIDKLNDFSDATGASIENLSALEDIAGRTGTSMDTVGDAVIKLNKTLADAIRPGSEAANAIKAIGLNAAELRKLDPAEAFRQVSVALAGFANDGNKARLVQELFGKSIREVAPLLNDVAEAGRFNATVTTEQAKAAEAFNKQLAEFQKNVTDAARALTGELLPALNRFFGVLKSDRGLFGTIADQFGEDYLRARLQAATDSLEEQLPAFERAKRLLAEQPDSFRAKNTVFEYEQLRKGAEAYRKELDALLATRAPGRRPANEGGGRVRSLEQSLPDIVADKKTTKPKEIEPFVVKLDDTTLAALKRLEDTDAQKIAALRLELQALIELRPEGGSEGSDEALRRIVEELARLDPEARKAAEAKQRLDAILAQTPSGALADVLIDIELINSAFEDGQISVETWADAVRVAVGKLPQDIEKPLAEISEFAKQAAANIQDALGDSVLALFKGNAQEIEEVWKNTLQRMAAQAAAAQIGKYLFGDQYGTTGQLGGALGQLFSFIGSYGGGRAMGGPVQKGRPYLVGERRAEIFVPDSNGRILPDASAAGGGAAPTFQMIVQGDASENTVRLVESMFAQFQARQMSGWRG